MSGPARDVGYWGQSGRGDAGPLLPVLTDAVEKGLEEPSEQ